MSEVTAKTLADQISALILRAPGHVENFAVPVELVVTFSDTLEYTLSGVVAAQSVAVKDDRPSLLILLSDGSVTHLPSAYILLRARTEEQPEEVENG